MILIGQYDSAFVRRVGVALTLYGMPFEHRPWSVFGDAEKIRPFNPLVRVPVLVLDDATTLIESHAMLDYLDGLVPEAQALWPRQEPLRHRALRVAALAAGLCEKGVSLFYARHLLAAGDTAFSQRMRGQMLGALAALEAERAGQSTAFWFGDRMSHADIAVATVLRHMAEALPDLVELAAYPALAAHCNRSEALPAFQKISQVFIAPRPA